MSGNKLGSGRSWWTGVLIATCLAMVVVVVTTLVGTRHGSFVEGAEVVWAQEEPRNMGAVAYVGPRLRNVVPREVKLSHVARPERASPAEGKNIGHVVEQARVVREVLNPA